MLLFEWLAVAYFVGFALAVPAIAVHGGTGRRAATASLLMASLVALAWTALPMTARVWLGHLYLVTGYWIPAMAAGGGDGGRFERWLVDADAAWQRRLAAVPQWLAGAGELSYLLCYPVVPAAFTVVWLAGTPADADRFWLAVLIAGFTCYVSLPWLTARPPRHLASGVPRGVARLNVAVLDSLSHGLTTFPSGHVAVAVAAGLSLIPISLPLALVFVGIAGGIAIGAATGRYHYVVDVMAGIAVGLIAPLVAALV